MGYNLPMAFDAYIFDLDGTLLDTLPDLVTLTNRVLGQQGWPPRTAQQILGYIGGGREQLLRLAAPPQATDDQLEAAGRSWEELYPSLGHRDTQPYPGIPELLAHLKERGARLGVLSNKFDGAVGQVIGDHFPGIFDEARGECDQIPRKPDPTGLTAMIERLGVAPSRTAYIGDSAGDILTAHGAGAFAIGVTWGYQPVAKLEEEGPDLLVSSPAQILEA